MSLYAQIEEIEKEEKKLANAETSDAEDVDAEDNAGDDGVVEKEAGEGEKTSKGDKKAKEEVEDEAEKAEDGAEDKAPPAADAPDAAAFARMRIEKAAADRKAKMLEDQLRQQQKPPEAAKAPAAASTEPDPNLDPEAHLRWKLDKAEEKLKDVADWKAAKEREERQVSLKTNAREAFQEYETQFKSTTPDYEAVTSFGLSELAKSITRLNPHLKGKALGDALEFKVLQMSAQAEAEGYDPAEYLYHTAKSWGYQPPRVEPKAEEERVKPKPDLKTIVNHKKKSASSLNTGGRSGSAPISKEAYASMPFHEVAKLSPEALREWESMTG